jgi:hypothetical protein
MFTAYIYKFINPLIIKNSYFCILKLSEKEIFPKAFIEFGAQRDLYSSEDGRPWPK